MAAVIQESSLNQDNNEAVMTRSLSVIAVLRDQILRSELQPDERLQEVALAEKLNVSRTPIREALRTLAEEGLLIYEPNRGYRVRRFSLNDILKAFRLRMALEGLSARLAAEKPLDAVIEGRFLSALQQGDDLLKVFSSLKKSSGFNVEAWRAMNKAFHFTIHHHADNELLLQTSRWATRIPVVIQGAFRWYQPADYQRSHDEHHRIFSAIKNGQPDRADHLMQEHIYLAMEKTQQHYAESFPE
jgi:GntR family transcriptional regulator of vanillate catabolism